MGGKVEWGTEIAQAGNDVAELAKDVGIPGMGLIARFAQHFYDRHVQKRFETFVANADVDEELIDQILSNEGYANCFYAALETVRQTHSKVGLAALALIYRDHWNDEGYLIAAMQSFAQISDKTIDAFMSLYEGIELDKHYLSLSIQKHGERCFLQLLPGRKGAPLTIRRCLLGPQLKVGVRRYAKTFST